MAWKRTLSRLLAATPLAHIPVRVQSGFAKGSRWTLLPFSTYWRYGGGERDVEIAVSYIPDLTGLVFWDFGAHFGIHTVGMAKQVGPLGQVAAFEPLPGPFSKLTRHVRLNDLRNVMLSNALCQIRPHR
jgi:hypothetical protein